MLAFDRNVFVVPHGSFSSFVSLFFRVPYTKDYI